MNNVEEQKKFLTSEALRHQAAALRSAQRACQDRSIPLGSIDTGAGHALALAWIVPFAGGPYLNVQHSILHAGTLRGTTPLRVPAWALCGFAELVAEALDRALPRAAGTE